MKASYQSQSSFSGHEDFIDVNWATNTNQIDIITYLDGTPSYGSSHSDRILSHRRTPTLTITKYTILP